MRHLLDLPCRGDITQIFGVNRERYKRFGLPGHNGVDWGFDVGTPIYLRVAGLSDGGRAADSLAVCVAAGSHPSLGNYVVVHVDDDREWEHGYFILYAHLQEDSCTAGIGVANGWLIGRMGDTGNSTGPHLHLGLYPCIREYEFRPFDDWKGYIDRTAGDGMKGAVDPLRYMQQRPSPETAPPVERHKPRDHRRALGQGLFEVRPDDGWMAALSKAVLGRLWKSVLVPMLLMMPWLAGDLGQAIVCPLGARVPALVDLCKGDELPAIQSAGIAPALSDQVTRLPGQTDMVAGIVEGPLNVRSCGHLDCAVVAVLSDGAMVNVIETSADGWHRIGAGRWVHGRYVQPGPRG